MPLPTESWDLGQEYRFIAIYEPKTTGIHGTTPCSRQQLLSLLGLPYPSHIISEHRPLEADPLLQVPMHLLQAFLRHLRHL